MDPVTVGVTAAVGGGLFVARKLFTRSKGKISTGFGDYDEINTSAFVCERVCTSDRLLRHMGTLVRDPIKGTCITVCGTSRQDACIEACQRAVCVNQHQVPDWNEACLNRCTAECTKGRSG